MFRLMVRPVLASAFAMFVLSLGGTSAMSAPVVIDDFSTAISGTTEDGINPVNGELIGEDEIIQTGVSGVAGAGNRTTYAGDSSNSVTIDGSGTARFHAFGQFNSGIEWGFGAQGISLTGGGEVTPNVATLDPLNNGFHIDGLTVRGEQRETGTIDQLFEAGQSSLDEYRFTAFEIQIYVEGVSPILNTAEEGGGEPPIAFASYKFDPSQYLEFCGAEGDPNGCYGYGGGSENSPVPLDILVASVFIPFAAFGPFSFDAVTFIGLDIFSETDPTATIGAFSAGVSAVPVPAALPLFLSGLIGLGLVARRRRKQTKA